MTITSIFIFQRSRTKRIQKEQKSLFARQILEIELKALRAQMNPHFIFNCLNSIQAFILRENTFEATEYLQKFSRLIRLILDNSQKTSNTIEDEVEILGLYLDLEQLRLRNMFDYEIIVSKDLDKSFVEIPSMIIQPVIENSIWHGFSNSDKKGMISVIFAKQQNQLSCTVIDNGIGRKKSIEIKERLGGTHESKGIKLIEDRLSVWCKTNGFKFELQIFDNIENRSGTCTIITILYPEND